MEPFQIETTVDAPQATVWRHFTEPADAMVTISTFGLDDAAFAAAEEGWTARWKALTA